MGERSAEILWTPPEDVRETTAMGRFLTDVEKTHGIEFDDYHTAWQWSVEDIGRFWATVADFFAVRFHDQPQTPIGDASMPGAEWFPGGTLSYPEHVLRGGDDDVVLVAHSESRDAVTLTRGELRQRVARVRTGLRRLGVGRGDRVAAYLPNCPEALIGLLAVTSLGAIWTICSPEFGTKGAVDRLAQTRPSVLLAADGYVYAGKTFRRTEEMAAIRREMPELQATVGVAHIDEGGWPADVLAWEALEGTEDVESLVFEPVPFDHPLYILYSSGTTGKPKPIVLGHGGMLLEHYKWIGLHDDVGPGDRYFWYSSTSWMAWNLGVSSLLCGAALVTWDGALLQPDLESFWRFMDRQGVTYLGTSPAFLKKCRSEGLALSELGDLTSIRTINSGGAPLPADLFRWVYEVVDHDLYLSSGSGGTDIGSSFVGGCRLLPVRAGEIACRLLGVDVHAFDEDGNALIGERGELVVTQPMPSMLVGFWGDDGSRLRETYFDRYPGVWCHGDWIRFTEEGTAQVTGRSDATLNRGGVRLGTSEFYSVVEQIPGITDSLIVHLEDAEGGLGELLLFISLEEGRKVDENLRGTIAESLRDGLSPRHVPDAVEVVPTIPRTVTMKKMEIPVKRILQGVPLERAASQTSLAVPGSLDAFVTLASGRRARTAR